MLGAPPVSDRTAKANLERPIPQAGRQLGNDRESALEEINGDLLEADFWPGITSG
jgi:hypothetical protein